MNDRENYWAAYIISQFLTLNYNTYSTLFFFGNFLIT